MKEIKLERSGIPLTSTVEKDDFIRASEKAFDCIFDGTSTFYPWKKPEIESDFTIGLIYGNSGSGKSTLLKEFGVDEEINWDNNKAIISHFNTPDEGINLLGAVGLNSIPTWYKPYNVLSNGEKFRANLARKLKDGCVIDEFTSVVDRNVAKSTSMSIAKYIRKNGLKNIVISTCHEDIIEWLEPDWVIDTNLGEYREGFFLEDQILISKYIKLGMISGPCLKTITI